MEMKSPINVHCKRHSQTIRNKHTDQRHIMTDFRRCMDPSTLEMLLILKYNKDLWDACTVDQIINTKTPAVGQKRPNPVADVDNLSVITTDI